MEVGFEANYNHDEKTQSWAITIDDKYTTAIKKYLIEDDIPEEGVLKIIENAAKTLSYCPDPSSNSQCQKTGIVIGKVQSGKTSNFIALTALAFDNGYNLAVVLGGTTKPLVQQNRDRIQQYFETTKEVLVLDTVDYLSEITSNKIRQFIRMGKKVVIVVLKLPCWIDYVRNNVFKGSSFVDRPILIIDDEGDEASLNTLVKKRKKSPTYKAIESLKAILNKHCFVSVTATPQANLLIDTLDILSPDFGVLVDPGKGYCGLDVFHSDDKYTIKIPDDETSLLDSGVPKSFKKALAMFFVACAIRKNRGMKPDEKVSMLIHPSQKRIDHQSVLDKVSKIVDEWISLSSNKDDIAYEDIKKILQIAYDEYANTTVQHIPEFSTIEGDIIQAINMCGMHKVNQDSALKKADDIYDYNIYVGGTMLGRGLTLNGLTVTYIIRTAKGVSNADTIQQRARWFGYKTKYLDLCRIFAVPKILNDFMYIREFEEDLWDTVRLSNMEGEEFKNMARIFVLSDNLRPTRRNVATTENFTFNFWNKQKIFQKDSDYIRNNESVLSSFKEKYKDKIRIEKYGFGAPFTIITSDFLTVFDEVLYKFIFPTEAKLNTPLITKLKSLLVRKKINPNIEVIWMRDEEGSTSKHLINENGSIPNYSVGRRPQDLLKPPIYLGDDYQFKKDNTMQLQIHMIKDIKSEIVSPTLALYLPTEVVGKLTNLVIKA